MMIRTFSAKRLFLAANGREPLARTLGPSPDVLLLGDGHALIVHKAWDAPLPAPGTRLGLNLSAEHLRPLGEGRSIVLGDEDVTVCWGAEVPA